MSSSYLPRQDTEFTAWVVNFLSYLGTHTAQVGLTMADLDEILVAKPQWEGMYDDHIQAQANARAKTAAKCGSRDTLEGIVRELVGRIQKYPGTTDADRMALGITVRSTAQEPVGVTPDDKPDPVVNASQRLRHVLRIQNQTLSGTSKAKPAWALGCEVWVKVGEMPVDENDLGYVGLVTRSPFEVNYTGDDGGKMAHYMLRWVGTKGEKGPWSVVESVTVAA